MTESAAVSAAGGEEEGGTNTAERVAAPEGGEKAVLGRGCPEQEIGKPYPDHVTDLK